MGSELSDLIGTSEAAEILGVSRAWIGQLIRAGALNGQKVGREWLLKRADVVAYAEADRPDRTVTYEADGEIRLTESDGLYVLSFKTVTKEFTTQINVKVTAQQLEDLQKKIG